MGTSTKIRLGDRARDALFRRVCKEVVASA
jgi:hypothetical protein